MGTHYDSGSQTFRSVDHGQSLYTPSNGSQPVITRYIYPQQKTTPRPPDHNQQLENYQKAKDWSRPYGPFQPYRTTYQDYGHDKTLNFRKPNNHLTQPYFYSEAHGIMRPPDSDPNKFSYDVPHTLNIHF